MTRRTQKAYDDWALAYDRDPNPHKVLEYEAVLSLVDAKKNEKILDAACGTGRYTHEFKKVGAEVIGIDFSEQMLKTARDKYPEIKFKKADLREELPFPDRWFDKINCAQTLKHLKELAPTLKEFFRVLRKGGIFVFSVTHPEMDWEGFEMKDRPDFVLSERSDIFQHRFSDYFDAFEETGFKIEKVVQLPISEKIRHLLTPESYQEVKGRYEVIVFKLIKP